MGVNRREFLKIAGLSAAVGLGGKTAFDLLWPGQLDAAEEIPPVGGLTAKRWGMVIDVRKFDEPARQAAVKACVVSHNIPEIPSKQNIKWIWETSYEHAFLDLGGQEYLEPAIKEATYLVLCNHCDNPPCVRVCPTKATFRRADGIVMMDMHRCIGCRFCMAACPYGSRSFNFADPRVYQKEPTNPDYPTRTKGVVEKCTFCTELLAKGLLPACVEASGGAMLFGDMADPSSPVRQALRSRYSIRRNAGLGTNPQVYYLI